MRDLLSAPRHGDRRTSAGRKRRRRYPAPCRWPSGTRRRASTRGRGDVPDARCAVAARIALGARDPLSTRSSASGARSFGSGNTRSAGSMYPGGPRRRPQRPGTVDHVRQWSGQRYLISSPRPTAVTRPRPTTPMPSCGTHSGRVPGNRRRTGWWPPCPRLPLVGRRHTAARPPPVRRLSGVALGLLNAAAAELTNDELMSTANNSLATRSRDQCLHNRCRHGF